MVAIALALAGCDVTNPTAANRAAAADGSVEGGYTARDAELSATGVDGKPRYQLRAASIAQQPGRESVAMQDVTVEFPDSRGQTWVLTAKTGTLSSTTREQPAIVDLEGEVLLKGPMSLETTRLRFDTARQRATTDQPVILRSGERRIEARGLTADLATRRLTLESQVHARFTP
jgi:LPS export ABC transporter protein LptC